MSHLPPPVPPNPPAQVRPAEADAVKALQAYARQEAAPGAPAQQWRNNEVTRLKGEADKRRRDEDVIPRTRQTTSQRY